MSRHTSYLLLLILASPTGCSREAPEVRVVFRSEDGRELTAEDLADAEGKFEYKIVDGDGIPPEANALHQKARQLGASGDYEAAIKALAEAQTLAPDWPYPTYDMAFTYLLMKDFTKARECYEKTVQMSPRGFFTALTALDTLNREANGELPNGTYADYVALEGISDPKQKLEAITAMLERIPSFAPPWVQYAVHCEDPSQSLAAIEKGLAAKPDRETHGMLLINKALTLNEQGDAETATSILGNLVLNPDTTFGNEHLAKQMLAMITQ
jgi:tetratricopeptide (TPR) repeat protein